MMQALQENKHNAATAQDKGIRTNLEELIALRQYTRTLPYHAKQRGHHSLSGVRLSQPLGRGLEFDQVRLYQPGDDLTAMDWKVTARTNKPHIKQYRQEKERPVVVVVDQRAPMHFGTRTAFKSVIAARFAALAAWLAIDNGERLGACVLSDDDVFRLPVKTGPQNALRLFQRLADQPISMQYQQQYDFNHAMHQLMPLVQNRCLVVFLSDFAGINEATAQWFNKLRPHCQVVAGFVYDVAEKNPPPPGVYPITNGLEESLIDLQQKQQQQRYQQTFVQHFQLLQKMCRQAQIPLHSIATNQDILANPLTHWLCKMS